MNIYILLDEFCEYSTVIRGYSKHTISRYKQMISFFARQLHIDQMNQITEQMVFQFFIYGRRDRNWSANTFISYHKTLLVFFRWCMERGYMDTNYMELIELPKLEQKLPVKMKKEEAFRILEVVYNLPYKYHFLRFRNHAIFAMYLYTGLRKSELLNLKLTDVDIKNLTLFVRQGKGKKDRIIPLCFKLVHILKTYLKERKRLNKTCPEFFTSLNRNMGFTEHGLKRVVEQVKEASSIKFSIHTLRHTFATLMLEGGCDIYSLSRMMGHSDIKTTTIYLSASAEHLRGQLSKHPLNELQVTHF